MGKSFIYCVNESAQEVQENGIVSPGSVIRRFGCNLNLVGNGVETRGDGYYQIGASITLDPAETGGVTAVLMQDGVEIPGANATTEATTTTTLYIPAAIRLRCCGDSASAITCVLSAGANVTNYTITIDKK